ncbi:MAG: tyrosine-type recombinase/integrase [Nitrososphaeria archaeon]
MNRRPNPCEGAIGFVSNDKKDSSSIVNSGGNDIYGVSQKLAWAVRRLYGQNGALAKSFLNHLRVKGLSDTRLWIYASRLVKIVEYFEARLMSATDISRVDAEEFAAQIVSKPYKAYTKHLYLLVFKKFVAYAKTGDSDNIPPEVSWLKLHQFNKAAERESRATPENLLTEDDVMKILSCATNPRDRALLHVLFEGALRPSELLTMRVSSVEFRDRYCVISVHGKTGLKRIPLVLSLVPLKEWLNIHPFKEDPNAPLWLSKKSRTPILYRQFHRILKKCVKKAGIKKNVWPYLFRHTQLTNLAKKLTESKLALYAGWVQGSKMARRYVHFSARDLEDIILEINSLPPHQNNILSSEQA